MNTKFNKIVKTAAVGIFFMALLMNVKVSLTNPFVSINNDVLAQTNSSSSNSFGGVCCQSENDCLHPYAGIVYSSSWKGGISYCP